MQYTDSMIEHGGHVGQLLRGFRELIIANAESKDYSLLVGDDRPSPKRAQLYNSSAGHCANRISLSIVSI